MERKINFNNDYWLTAKQIIELSTLVENQETSDKDGQGEYQFDRIYGWYDYIIDKDGDVLGNKVSKTKLK